MQNLDAPTPEHATAPALRHEAARPPTTARVTPLALSRAAGAAAVAAGLVFILIQLVHPTETVTAVADTRWAVAGAMTMAFAVLGLIGVTGIYLRQVERAGVTGLVGYLLLSGMLLLTAAFSFAETLVLPPLVELTPSFVDGFLGITTGGASDVDLGALGGLGVVSFALYLSGGALLGIASIRAGVLARWAAWALLLAALSTLLVPLLPHAIARYAAVPMGVALVGLGASLYVDASPRRDGAL